MNKNTTVEEKTLYIKTLDEGRFKGVQWKTQFQFRQSIYSRYHNGKRIEDKYNKVYLVVDKNGVLTNVPISLEAASNWLSLTIRKERELRKNQLNQGIINNDSFSKYRDSIPDIMRYYTYQRLTDAKVLITQSDGFRGYSVCILDTGLKILEDLLGKMSYCFQWDKAIYQAKNKIEEMFMALFIHVLARKIIDTKFDSYASWKNGEEGLLVTAEEKNKFVLDNMNPDFDSEFKQKFHFLANLLNISLDDVNNIMDVKIHELKKDIREVSTRVWTYIETKGDPSYPFNFEGILSLND